MLQLTLTLPLTLGVGILLLKCAASEGYGYCTVLSILCTNEHNGFKVDYKKKTLDFCSLQFCLVYITEKCV